MLWPAEVLNFSPQPKKGKDKLMLHKSLFAAAIVALAPAIAFAQGAPVAVPSSGSSPAVAQDSVTGAKATSNAAVHKVKHHAAKAKTGAKTEKSVVKPAPSQP
jgi:hypothetical protein